MKCPACAFDQKYKGGMVCGSCGYRFALDPKKAPHVTDMAFKKAVDRLSMLGEYHFTHNQLFAQIHRLILKKRRSARIGGMIALAVLGIILYFLGVRNLIGEGLPGAILFGALWLLFVVHRWRSPVKIPHEQVNGLIRTYQAAHPMERLVTGRAFDGLDREEIDAEFLRYAPERIVVVERDDLADMLLLNRFHFENKALVVSASKYPRRAFAACRAFLDRHPDLPVFLFHDASRKGHRMKTDLLADPAWNLAGKTVKDLGLNPYDVERLRSPLWIPDPGGKTKGKYVRIGGKPIENIEDGYMLPVDIGAPRSAMGALSLAAGAGLVLASPELLAQQAVDARGGGGLGGGFG